MATTFRVSDLRFLAGLLLPLGLLFNMLVHPDRAGIGAFVIWIAVALVDGFWPGAHRSPPAGGSVGFLRWTLRLYVPVQVALLAVGIWVTARAEWAIVVGVAYGAGFLTGAQGITFAHELGHSRNKVDRFLGWVLMTCVNYPQFMVEHYRGHHVKAATHDDPASARLGESLWRFLPRTVVGSTIHAWQLEAKRLVEMKRGWISSPLLWATAVNVAFLAGIVALAEWKVLFFWLFQSAFAVWLLETVNYIEHYGLSRAPREPFGVQHAWNADHVVSNSLLANLQRHSDHHVNAWKPAAQLEALPGPQLPTGYAGCLLLAAVPPLWFRVMHPRLTEPRWQRNGPALGREGAGG
ncbi:alkane 1-monooxygenase [Ramlibacter sp. PS4R-6]|uniref:alkane 1-monooxygenase n=1 Tax=Ramlibacter sp. PS4R-6 TaxID=3133438 RepID=UPI0030A62761